MKESTGIARGRTRWRRFMLAFIPASGIVGTVMVLMAMGVLAIPITISGSKFTVSASSLTSHPAPAGQSGFVQYSTVDQTVAPGVQAVAVTDLTGGALLTDLDQVVCGAAPIVGHIQVEIKASQADATGGLVVDLTSLTTDASAVSTFNNIKIGVPAPAYIPDPAAVGSFAQTADSFSITGGNLHQTAYYTQAGTFALTGLSLTVTTPASCP